MQTRQSLRTPLEFVSVKTRRPIPNGGGLVGDALVQATLDPCVVGIDVFDPSARTEASVASGTIVFLRRDGLHYLDIASVEPLRSLADHDAFLAVMKDRRIARLIRTGDDIMREPLFTACRMVWSRRHVSVGLEMRLRLMATLDEEGPLRLDTLCRMVPGPQDPLAVVMSLACAGEIELNLADQGFSANTTVRLSA